MITVYVTYGGGSVPNNGAVSGIIGEMRALTSNLDGEHPDWDVIGNIAATQLLIYGMRLDLAATQYARALAVKADDAITSQPALRSSLA